MSNNENIRTNVIEAYNSLLQRTRRACEHHRGDNLVLNRMLRELRTFIDRFVQVCPCKLEPTFWSSKADWSPFQHGHLFTPEEVERCEDSMSLSLSMLVEAREHVPDRSPLPLSTRVRTGRPGRPRVHVDPTLLARSMEVRSNFVGLATEFKCSSRTLRRIALAAQLVEPGAPVISYDWDEEGNLYRIHQSSTPRVATLSDQELDDIVGRILAHFPTYGRGSMWGALKSRGYNVPEPRISASIVRVRGVPRPFGRNDRPERKYKTDGPLSSVHHDGQHGTFHEF
ncbi:hypothetical protein SCHPADRAFT_641304 [Schizopora paradoxa]|uniref:Uncharacterized protein n=1 Tax=Schizopora paradoxa TaxID=27342 RepID=A0A0H2R6X9_9AGAM|nr:hypothetical protein SCHPADRAFT_641304 [Schizopora paradoxa]